MRDSIRRTLLALTISAALALTGCASNYPNQDIGTVVGGILGGIGGAQIGDGRGRTAAIILGTIVGAAIGQNIGRTMDEVDRMYMTSIFERNPTYRSTSWRNVRSGNQYTVTPRRTYQSATRRYCRDYTLKARIGRRYQQVYGTACRQSDGSWQLRS